MKFKVFAAAALALSLIGLNPGNAKAGDNGLFGAAIGAAGGGFLGSHIGSGDGRLAATAAGTLIGAVIGASMAQAGDYEPYGDHYRIVEPRPQPRPQVRYMPPTPPRKVVVHKRQVIVKHVYPDGYGKAGWNPGKGWKKKRREQERRRLTQACYDHPRRCASAF